MMKDRIGNKAKRTGMRDVSSMIDKMKNMEDADPMEDPKELNLQWWKPIKKPKHQWCSDLLYIIPAGNIEGSALAIARNIENYLRTRGVRAWYRIMP